MTQKLVELFTARVLAHTVAFGPQCVQPQFAVMWVYVYGIKGVVSMMEAEDQEGVSEG